MGSSHWWRLHIRKVNYAAGERERERERE